MLLGQDLRTRGSPFPPPAALAAGKTTITNLTGIVNQGAPATNRSYKVEQNSKNSKEPCE